MKPMKKLALGIAAAITGAAMALPAMATDWPTRPVTMIVPYPAGQGTDLASRYFAEQLTEALGQPIIVDNRPGAGGNVGTAYAARVTPDGYTILMAASGTHAMNPHLYADVGYDALNDFHPVAATIMIPMAISANESLGVSSIPELIAAAKARPGEIDVALPSVTSALVIELLKEAGAPLNGIRYRGSADAQAAVLGNQVPVLVDTLGASRRQFERLVPIAVTSPKAATSVPDLKSVAEQGVEGFEVTAWNMLYVIKGTPPEIRDRLEAVMAEILARPETAKALAEIGFEMAPAMNRAEREAWAAEQFNRTGEIIRAAGLTIE